MEKGSVRDFIVSFGAGGKRYFHILTYAKLLKDLNGKPKNIVASITDVTIIKEAEEKLKEAVKVKENFTATVSHELRTPLTAISEGVSIVLDGIVGEINEEQKEFLTIVKVSVERLARLISNVLDFQRLESGQEQFEKQEHDLNKVIREIHEIMFPATRRSALSFRLVLDEKIPLVFFDKDKISQVLINLINNAVKFTTKGSIVITTSREEDRVKVVVSDSGPGIKKEDLPKLFMKFTQLQRKVGGTGLGLAICQEIIKAHDGQLWAESELGKGTDMCFWLPVKRS